jgi:hypothetical protein
VPLFLTPVEEQAAPAHSWTGGLSWWELSLLVVVPLVLLTLLALLAWYLLNRRTIQNPHNRYAGISCPVTVPVDLVMSMQMSEKLIEA